MMMLYLTVLRCRARQISRWRLRAHPRCARACRLSCRPHSACNHEWLAMASALLVEDSSAPYSRACTELRSHRTSVLDPGGTLQTTLSNGAGAAECCAHVLLATQRRDVFHGDPALRTSGADVSPLLHLAGGVLVLLRHGAPSRHSLLCRVGDAADALRRPLAGGFGLACRAVCRGALRLQKKVGRFRLPVSAVIAIPGRCRQCPSPPAIKRPWLCLPHCLSWIPPAAGNGGFTRHN